MKRQRTRLIGYLAVLMFSAFFTYPMLRGQSAHSKGVHSPELDATASSAPPPKSPFTDFRFGMPGTIRKITVQDIPAPFATESAGNAPKLEAMGKGSRRNRLLRNGSSRSVCTVFLR